MLPPHEIKKMCEKWGGQGTAQLNTGIFKVRIRVKVTISMTVRVNLEIKEI